MELAESSNPERLVLRPSKRKWLLILLGSAAFVLVGALMIRAGGSVPRAPFGDARFWGVVCVIFFGLGIPLSLAQLLTARSSLKLTPVAFTISTLVGGSRTVPWSDVSSFKAEVVVYRAWPLKPMKMVRFDYGPTHPVNERMRALARSVSGHDAVLPDTYGMSAEDLAVLMDGWRARYGRTSA